MRILIADDHAIVRKGLIQILNEVPEVFNIEEASNGWEAIEKAKKTAYSAVLLDISMPGINGLDVLKQLKVENPNLPVLVLSMYPEEQYAVRILRAGASGYLTKESAPDELVKAVRQVARGKSYISPKVAEQLVLNLANGGEDLPHSRLSDREFQVLCMIASGHSIKQIATELSLSVKTVSTYRARILEKMGMTNNAEIISYAIKNELLV
jgi:two-component system invasion response regulator UvrY